MHQPLRFLQRQFIYLSPDACGDASPFQTLVFWWPYQAHSAGSAPVS